MKPILKNSRLLLVLSIILVFPALLVASIVILDNKPRILRVQADGIEVSATVISKYKETTTCGKSSCNNYILNLLYFDKPEDETEQLELGPDFVIELPKIQIGSSHSSSLKVSSRFYKKTQSGDSIKIFYLENDFDNVWISYNVANWNIWNSGLWFSLVVLVFAALLFYLSLIFRKKEEKAWLELGLE